MSTKIKNDGFSLMINLSASFVMTVLFRAATDGVFDQFVLQRIENKNQELMVSV